LILGVVYKVINKEVLCGGHVFMSVGVCNVVPEPKALEAAP
jgi:hypothetical protein